MFTTKNDVSQKVRMQINELLQNRLSDSIDLLAQIKHAHWNVKGPSFIALHKLFDEIWNESQEYADLIAERIMQFGGSAQGTVQVAAKKSNLPAYPPKITNGLEHADALARALAAYGELIREAIDQADELKDAGTADIFTEISRGIDKNLWFVEAHLQTKS